MLVLRFMVGLGVGGVWPNAVALAAECWPDKSRPILAGLMGAALNGGILMLSQVARTWHITPESWRWIFQLAAAPAVLGLLALTVIPESPLWLAMRRRRGDEADSSKLTPSASSHQRLPSPLPELFRPPLLRLTLIGILIGTIPMVGAWAASKWMIPWADKAGGASAPGYKAITQGWWALGAVLGSFTGAQIAAWLGRRRAYAIMSAGAAALTALIFLGTAPLQASFLPIVFAQGFVATLFFGWLPLYLPELFPTVLRRLDCVLEKTKADVIAMHKKLKTEKKDAEAIEKIITHKIKVPFFNISEFTFETLLGDPDKLAANLGNYIAGFSSRARKIIEKFKFDEEIEMLEEANRLFEVVKQVAAVDLHPDTIPNIAMGYVFEDLVRRFNEQANEEAGDHFTPREVIKLMVTLLSQHRHLHLRLDCHQPETPPARRQGAAHQRHRLRVEDEKEPRRQTQTHRRRHRGHAQPHRGAGQALWRLRARCPPDRGPDSDERGPQARPK